MVSQIVFNSIMKIVGEKYPDIHPDKLQTVFIPYVERPLSASLNR